MKYIFILISVLIPLSIGIILILNRPKSDQISMSNTPSPTLQATPTTTPQELTASFKIITDQITRNFSNPKYHNQSEDVFIKSENPSQIFVKKPEVTWQVFFNTLPMKLTKDCLTTGDGENFCNGKDGSLKFYINQIEDKDALNKIINQNDSLLVVFKSN